MFSQGVMGSENISNYSQLSTDPELEMKMKGINMFPMMHFMMTSMSDNMRRNAVTKQVKTLYIF